MVEGSAEGGEDGREKGCVGECHQFGRSGGERCGVGAVLGTGVSRGRMVDWKSGGLVVCKKGEVPQTSVGRTYTGDDGTVVVCYGDGVGVESCNAAGVAELAHGDEGARGEVGENVGGACRKGEIREIKFSRVAGMDDAAVREGDGDAVDGRPDVDERGIDGKEMASTAGVGYVGR